MNFVYMCVCCCLLLLCCCSTGLIYCSFRIWTGVFPHGGSFCFCTAPPDGAPTAGAAGRDHAAATEWPRYDPDNGAENLRIDFEMSLEGEYRAEYCSFWEDLQLQLRKENLHGRIYLKQQKE